MGEIVVSLFLGFILWLALELIVEPFEYVEENVILPIIEGLRDLFGLEQDQPKSIKPFVVSEYLARIEEASLDILKSREPVDKIIVLWWGLDGLRLDEDGQLEWIGRNQNKPTVSVQFIPPGSLRTGMLRNPWFDQTQSTRAQIDALMAQSMTSQVQSLESARIMNLLQQLQTPAQYPPYYYSGCYRPN